MPENTRMSRRDWFRLRPARDDVKAPVIDAPELTREPVIGHGQETLRPVAVPENYGGINLADLPPMRESLLSKEQVAQLFSDIELLGSNVLLMQRLPNAQRTSASSVASADQLKAAMISLVAGTIARVQIRYRWEESNWIDTLERTENGFRLVRIQHRGV
ncbi:MAG: hypothetical protein R3C12_21680 [Planctomycetaceae bacterium]|nr:hypothetical protein [Planctomycetales bacterium]